MLLRRTRRFYPFVLFGLLLLAIVSMTCWLWISGVSDRVLASLTRQTGLTFVDKTLSFDPWQRQLSVNDIQFKEKGVQLSSGQLSFVLIYRHWWEPWLGKDAEALSAVELVGAEITIDPEQMSFPLPDWFQELSIEDGNLSVTGIDETLSFEQLTLKVAGENTLDVHVSGEAWDFSGTYETSQGLLGGELNLNEFPLGDLISPGGVLLAENTLFEGISGTINARLSLLWDKQNGLVLQGSAEGQNGSLAVKGSTIGWQQWQLHDLQFHGRDRARSSAALSLTGVDLKLADIYGKFSTPAINELKHFLPFAITSLAVKDSRLEMNSGSIPWVFENIQGRLVAGNGKSSLENLPMSEPLNPVRPEPVEGRELRTKVSCPASFDSAQDERRSGTKCRTYLQTISEDSKGRWQYQAVAYLQDVGNLQLQGTVSNNSRNNNFTLSLDNAHLAGPLKRYSELAGYNIQGSRFNLNYDSGSHRGELAITDWQYKKLRNRPPGDLLIGLLTDKGGKATIRFKTKSAKQTGSVSSLLSALPGQVYQAIDQRFMVIGQAPFEYLSSVTGYAIEPLLRHEAGKAPLTQPAYTNLKNLQKAMVLRPELKVLVDVGVSESEDWPELSRYQLEEALQELYSATGSIEGNDASVIPAKVRARLLEQMYLATQQQKIPEVGDQSPEQRVQKAEKWLLANWPRAPGQIEKLQQARYDYLRDEAGRLGIDAGRIALQLSSSLAGEPDSVLILR